jgi:hypothetical protein
MSETIHKCNPIVCHWLTLPFSGTTPISKCESCKKLFVTINSRDAELLKNATVEGIPFTDGKITDPKTGVVWILEIDYFEDEEE